MGLDMGLCSHKKGTNKNLPYADKEEYYWRKANAIHKWFVDNVQEGADDCGEYEVSKSQLLELVLIIKEILNKPDENSRIESAKELLPTCDGFFFGDTSYDDYYFNTLIDTQTALEKILNQFDFEENVLLYWSSW